jgi:hypothetical protein
MKRRCRISLVLLLCLMVPGESLAATLQPQTLRAWDAYVSATEKRIASELDGSAGFLRIDFMSPSDKAKATAALKSGQVYVLKMRTTDANRREIDVPDGLIHHWFGAIFVPNVSSQALIRAIQDYDHHTRYFKEVQQSKLVSREGDTFKIFLRLMRKKVVTVHYNTDHTVIYRTHDNSRISSRSFTTKIAELDAAGSATEKEKPVGDDSGYFWRLNSYWRFKEQDGGVVVECESISLSRSIPFGLGWLIKGFVESVPRESLESTMTSIRDGVAASIQNK